VRAGRHRDRPTGRRPATGISPCTWRPSSGRSRCRASAARRGSGERPTGDWRCSYPGRDVGYRPKSRDGRHGHGISSANRPESRPDASARPSPAGPPSPPSRSPETADTAKRRSSRLRAGKDRPLGHPAPQNVQLMCRRTTFSASSLALGLNFEAKRSTRSLRHFHIAAHYPIRRFLPARMEFPTRTRAELHATNLFPCPKPIDRPWNRSAQRINVGNYCGGMML